MNDYLTARCDVGCTTGITSVTLAVTNEHVVFLTTILDPNEQLSNLSDLLAGVCDRKQNPAEATKILPSSSIFSRDRHCCDRRNPRA